MTFWISIFMNQQKDADFLGVPEIMALPGELGQSELLQQNSKDTEPQIGGAETLFCFVDHGPETPHPLTSQIRFDVT